MAVPKPVTRRDVRPRWHYAFVVAAVTFGVLVAVRVFHWGRVMDVRGIA